MPYPPFDVARLQFRSDSPPLLTPDKQLGRDDPVEFEEAGFSAAVRDVGEKLVTARNQGGATIFLFDSAVVLAGAAPHLVDLLEKGLITHAALDPLAACCDWQYAVSGKVEGVPIPGEPELCLPERHAEFHAIIAEGLKENRGCGESLGRRLFECDAPYRRQSLLAEGYRWGVPVTVHGAIGGDFLQTADSFDPAVAASAWHRDFLVLANSVENLEQGLLCQFGHRAGLCESGPELSDSGSAKPTGCDPWAFRTALLLANNVAAQYARSIADFDAVRFTLPDAPESGHEEDSGDFPKSPESLLASEPQQPATRRHVIEVPAGKLPQTIAGLRHAALKAAGWEV